MEIGKIDPYVNALSVAATPAVSPQERAEQRNLIRAVEAVNKSEVFGASDELQFSFDRQTRRPILKLVDKKTKEVIRQIPPEYVLRLAQENDKG